MGGAMSHTHRRVVVPVLLLLCSPARIYPDCCLCCCAGVVVVVLACAYLSGFSSTVNAIVGSTGGSDAESKSCELAPRRRSTRRENDEARRASTRAPAARAPIPIMEGCISSEAGVRARPTYSRG